MAAPHMLIIDDELAIRRVLRASLSERGYRVSVAATGEEGLAVVVEDTPDLVILDLGLPDMDGTAVCRQIRAWSDVPIVILSARYDEMEKVRVLDSGADDYLTKPFGTHELLARIRVALRHRMRRETPTTLIAVGELRINLVRRHVLRGDNEVHLTPTEYALLTALAAQAGRVLTHTWLLQHVWGPGYEENIQNLHVFISQLRRKLEPHPAIPRYILTEPGIGYRFAQPEEFRLADI